MQPAAEPSHRGPDNADYTAQAGHPPVRHIANHDLYKFNPQDRGDTEEVLYPYFKSRGIDLYAYTLPARHFCLATKREDGAAYTNLAFLPLTLPKGDGTVVGFEERGRARMDGSGSYKGKAEGSNSSEGCGLPALPKPHLREAKRIYWFESACDAMAYYQQPEMGQGTAKGSVRFYRRGTEPAVQSHDKRPLHALTTISASTRTVPDRSSPSTSRSPRRARHSTSNVTKDDKLLVRISGEENQNYEIKLEPFDFHRIIGTLLRPKEIYREDGTLDYRTIGDGYLQEMSMVCQDEYEIALAEGSASERKHWRA